MSRNRGIRLRDMLLFFLIFLVFPTCSVAQNEFQTLLELKRQFIDPEGNLRSWDQSNGMGICEWRGISCNGTNQVTSITLSKLSLQGFISPAIGRLKSLQALDLSMNNITGSIPEEIMNCTSLSDLNLGDNKINGSIPQQLGHLAELRLLRLHQNNLQGPIPTSIGFLNKLTRLRLDENQLTGSIPREIGNCSSLKFFQVYDNLLEGNIPAEVGNLGQLSHLSVYKNRLSGTIPRDLGKCRFLQRVSLSENNFEGELFPEVGLLFNLKSLEASGCGLSGPVPPSLGNITGLQELDLSVNKMSGVLPDSLGSGWKQLTKLNFSMNSIYGLVPTSFGDMVDLASLDLSFNNFSGIFPSTVGLLPNMTTLLVSSNSFQGNIPPSGLCAKGGLTLVSLSGNNLNGMLTGLTGDCVSLVTLEASNNRFSGDFPAFDSAALTRLDVSSNQSRLQHLLLSGNQFSGQVPDEVQRLTELVALNISHNSFGGNLPDLSMLSQLRTLDVSYNNLTGSILPSFGNNLQMLETIDFSNNNFTGSIPETMDNLRDLQYFNFSSNHFSGSIPPIKAFISGPQSAFLNNPGLCGPPLGTCSSQTPASPPRKSRRRNKSAGRITGLVFIILAGLILCSGAGFLFEPDSDNKGNYYYNAAARKLSRIRHPNVVNLEGFIIYGGNRIFLYEYMPNKSLGEILHAPLGPKLHHQGSIVHCDIKSNNVMLDSAFGAHIGDVGLAKLARDPKHLAAVDRTYGYAAPEGARVSLKADVYSFGVVLLELLTGRKPIFEDGSGIVTWVRNSIAEDQPMNDIADPILRNANAPFQEEISSVCKVALACTDSAPNRRPTMKEVVDVLARIRREPGGPKLRSLRSFIHRRSFILLSTSEREMDKEP